MSTVIPKTKNHSSLEAEMYLLIAKFLSTGPCQKSAEVIRQEIEEHGLMSKRIDWLGNYHSRSFYELEQSLPHISSDYLLKICARIAPILDKEIPPIVPGVHSLLGAGHQSLLRTSEDLLHPKLQSNSLAARHHGSPLYPSQVSRFSYPPNITQMLMIRELSGPSSCMHFLSSKVYSRQQMYRRLLGHLSAVYCVLFDRTGKFIFTGADDLLVKIWSSTDGRLLSTLRGHAAEITDMAVNYENTLLATGSCDKIIRVWCLRTIAPVAVLVGHTGMVTSLQFCPYSKSDNRYLISTGNDGCVCFWSWNVKNSAFNPKPIKFTERNRAGAQMICSSFSSGGVFLATGSTDHHIRVYNIQGTNGPEKILEVDAHLDRVDSLQFSNLGCRFITGSKDGCAHIWRYERQSWQNITLKMNTKLPGSQPDDTDDSKQKLRVTMVGWNLDDSMVITAVHDHCLKVWNSYNGTLQHVLMGHEDEVFVLEAHPTDPRVLLSGGHDGRIILWDLYAGTIIKSFFNVIEGQGHGAVFDCKFSPDGFMFASTDSHGHLSIFGFGSNDRYKRLPEELFFHTDYRPLIRDINNYVLDEQTQCVPHLMPPPFLVDIDGNPYPPSLQRLVPGREHCNDSQLIPYVAVSADGEPEILQPVRPMDMMADPNRPTIDDMIERLQHEQDQRQASFGSPDNGERNAQESFSPRSAARSQQGHSRVGMRRSGDIEGVRQSSGNWQSRDNQSEIPTWTKRVVVKPITLSSLRHEEQRRNALADQELSHYNKEKKRRPLPDPSEVPLFLDERNLRRKRRVNQQKQSVRARSARETSGRNRMYGEDYENPEDINLSSNSSFDSDDAKQNIWDDSSGDSDSGSGEYSDWTADAGFNLEPKQKSKPSTLRPRRQVTSEDDDTDDEPEESENDKKTEENNNTTNVKKKKEHKKSKEKSNQGGIKEVPKEFRPPEWLTDVMPHKAPYVPQMGDEVVYFRQGHELYVQAVKRAKVYDITLKNQPWRKMKLRDQEVAKITDIKYEIRPPRLCFLRLSILNPSGQIGDTFIIKYHDMPDVIDFLVLKRTYDQAMQHNWKPGDRFRSAIDNAWWLGTIEEHKPLHSEFPDSMFQCFLVRWDNGEKEQMSPWDFEPIDERRMPDCVGGSVEITADERKAMMYVPTEKEWPKGGRDAECERLIYGLERITELSIAEPFSAPVDLNRYPMYAMVVEYPIDLTTVKARLENRFYRRLDAVRFDVSFIETNARKFNEPDSRIVKQARCVTQLCVKLVNNPNCDDPMMFYQEMIDNKLTRFVDSSSDQDTECSGSESEGEEVAEQKNKGKRKKQSTSQQPSKRVRLETQQYTSRSWRQQCLDFINVIFQCDDSTPFRHPVDLSEYSDYRNIIDIPMDLGTVKERLVGNHYRNPIEFCKDMRLIFQNSRNYNTNKKSRIYSMTIRLSAMFEEHIRSIVSDWRSAVKYEEKLKNNQYVSHRRRPLPQARTELIPSPSTSHAVHRPTVHRISSANVTKTNATVSSHTTSNLRSKEDSVRPGSSRSTTNVNSVTTASSSKITSTSSHGVRANGSVLRRKIKIVNEDQEERKEIETRSSKGQSVPTKKVKMKNKLGAGSLANGEVKKNKKFLKNKSKIVKSGKKVSKRENLPEKKKKKKKGKKLLSVLRNYSDEDINPINTDTELSSNLLDEESELDRKTKKPSISKNIKGTALANGEVKKKRKKKKKLVKNKTKPVKGNKSITHKGNLPVKKRGRKRLRAHRNDSDEEAGHMNSDTEISSNIHDDDSEMERKTRRRQVISKTIKGKNPMRKAKLKQICHSLRPPHSLRTCHSLRATHSLRPLPPPPTPPPPPPFLKSLRSRQKLRSVAFQIFKDSDSDRSSDNDKSDSSDSSCSSSSSSSSTSCKSASKKSTSHSNSSNSDSESHSSSQDSDKNANMNNVNCDDDDDSVNDSDATNDDDDDVPVRRSARTATRNCTRATRSALHTRQQETTTSGRVQTRNRGRRTVRYEEERSDVEYEGDSDKSINSNVRETVSFSSRGRLRKLTRHAREMLFE